MRRRTSRKLVRKLYHEAHVERGIANYAGEDKSEVGLQTASWRTCRKLVCILFRGEQVRCWIANYSAGRQVGSWIANNAGEGTSEVGLRTVWWRTSRMLHCKQFRGEPDGSRPANFAGDKSEVKLQTMRERTSRKLDCRLLCGGTVGRCIANV